MEKFLQNENMDKITENYDEILREDLWELKNKKIDIHFEDINPDDLTHEDLNIFDKLQKNNLTEEEFNLYRENLKNYFRFQQQMKKRTIQCLKRFALQFFGNDCK